MSSKTTTGKKPRKWHEVYSGNDEHKVFIALARHSKFTWRSVSAMAQESGLTKRRVEEILKKYSKAGVGMVFNSSSDDQNWAYWERVPELLDPAKASLAKVDQDARVDRVMGVPASAPAASPKKGSSASGKGKTQKTLTPSSTGGLITPSMVGNPLAAVPVSELAAVFSRAGNGPTVHTDPKLAPDPTASDEDTLITSDPSESHLDIEDETSTDVGNKAIETKVKRTPWSK